MKVERVIKHPNVFAFAKTHLPSGLITYDFQCGYGYFYCIIHPPKPNWIKEQFMTFNSLDPIADVCGDVINLRHPQYFSDMENLARAYEAATGFEVTLKYWQTPKDTPLEKA